MVQDTKRQSIFNKIKNDNGIILLQETHSTVKTEKKWKNEWGGQIIFSHGTSNSRGVATLFPPNVDYTILEKYSDNNGKFLLVKCKCEETIYNN